LAQPDHRLDMKMLLLLTQRLKCSLVLDSSNQSGQTFWLKQPEYRSYINMWSGNIGLHCDSDQTRHINVYANVGYFKCHSELK